MKGGHCRVLEVISKMSVAGRKRDGYEGCTVGC